MRIDGLQYANWSQEIFRQMREGGVDCVHATIAYHESFRTDMSANARTVPTPASVPTPSGDCAALDPYPEAARFRRDPDAVMRLARMGAFHRTRLSFLQVLLRRLSGDGWRFERGRFELDDIGTGRAVYTVHGPERSYSLVAFAHDLPAAARSDRVIATAWDATFALFDGVPDEADLERLAANVPLQEAGRVSATELTLSRANRSVRLFEHAVDALSRGEQPDADALDATGYLMRTTAVYGSGKFGAADRARVADRPELAGPFRAEMLTVWLIRAFTLDLVEHLARVRGGDRAVPLEPALRRRVGVGNSTGLGMAPFLVNHPMLPSCWMMAREEALARVRAVPRTDAATATAFRAALGAAREDARCWTTDHPEQKARVETLRGELDAIGREAADLSGTHPWDRLHRWAEGALSLEGQEALVSLLLEPYGALVDALADCMAVDEGAGFRIDGRMRVGELRSLVHERYRWALDVDHDAPERRARFWYTSEEKLEPRLGERHAEPGAELEQPLAIGRDVQRLARALDAAIDAGDETVELADLLLERPEHRHVVRRVQPSASYPFSEVRDNLIDADMRPIDLLRCKLSFFGAARFDPRSDRWVRISLFQGLPHPHELLAPAP